ncbi:MAG: hypothetical protein AAGO57_09445 [Pseudomonadota bacterium]
MLTRVFLAGCAALLALPVLAGSPTKNTEIDFGPETLALVAATETLFDALEAEGMQAEDTPRLQLRSLGANPVAMVLPEAGRAALRDDLGPVADLTAYDITWYPGKKLAGSVDFVGTWKDGRNLVCGYVTWDMSDPRDPNLAAMTTSYLDTKNLVRLPDAAAHGELLRANCAFGALEPNLELVRPAPKHFP